MKSCRLHSWVAKRIIWMSDEVLRFRTSAATTRRRSSFEAKIPASRASRISSLVRRKRKAAETLLTKSWSSPWTITIAWMRDIWPESSSAAGGDWGGPGLASNEAAIAVVLWKIRMSLLKNRQFKKHLILHTTINSKTIYNEKVEIDEQSTKTSRSIKTIRQGHYHVFSTDVA